MDDQAEPLPDQPDTALDPDEEEEVSRLTQSEIEAIDLALLSNCTTSWRKVARVVGSTYLSLRDEVDVPDGFYARRVIALVQDGKLESQGNLEYMRFSEVKLTDGGANAV